MRHLDTIESIKQRYHQLSSRQECGVYFISDRANWAFDQITSSLIKELEERLGVRAHKSRNPWRLTGQIIHFINRYAILKGPYQDLRTSNQVFLNWYHGGESGTGSAFDPLLDSLFDVQHLLQKVVVPCTIAHQALVDYGVPTNKLVVIPIGVALDQFKQRSELDRIRIRAGLKIPQKAVCIGSFQKDGAGWGEGREPKLVKGPDVFLNVIDRLSKLYSNLHVLLTGPARGYVKQGLVSLGIAYTHHYVSNYKDMVDYYNALDVYLITSRSEGGPMSLLESWATGVPVVSTRVGMPADLIIHGENGLLADVDDVTGLTEAMSNLIEDEQLSNQCRENAFHDAKEFDWSLIAKEYYERLYKPVLNRH